MAVYNGTENDDTYGGTAADMLYGEAGRDVLIGDTGADSFVYMTLTESPVAVGLRDRIRDFSHAQGDRIDLSAIDAITGGANTPSSSSARVCSPAWRASSTPSPMAATGRSRATSTATSWPISWSR